MTVTIYHNPACSKSRETLALIRAAGIKPQIVEYLAAPLGAQAIQTLLAESGLPARDAMRSDVPEFTQVQPDWSEAQLIEWLAQHPRLLNRPFVRSSKGTRLCRPPELVHEIL
ncbi:MAG: arsenate reductase (glutaredoxin) [Brachymonas sp.]|nr:arsenate reductase (glutaredoxin) [Brachymonas sp.]